uniref:DNA2/NAM7 helicase-like C-terminal domain-containing protein n=1 Tax=Romanomermis culicivorax TaxID=13658 RepID=A0A915HMX4_ROMCU
MYNNNSMYNTDRYLQLPKTYLTMISGFPIVWVNVTSLESLEDNSHLIQNVREARAIGNLVASLIGMQKFKNEDIVIMTSYSAKVKLLRNTVLEACKAINVGTCLQNRYLPTNKLENQLKKVQIGTMDGFQGQESDIVIYNIIRSNPYFFIGFLENYKRLNVAICRARCLLFIIGNATMFLSLEEGQTFVNKELPNNPS